MKYKLLAAALTLLATQTAVAMSDPFPCPTVASLKRVGITSLTILNGGPTKEWSGIERSNSYDTGVDWTFFITIRGLIGKPRNEILGRANTAISSLVLEGGPWLTHDHPDGAEKAYFCKYNSIDGSSDWSIAITPTFNGNGTQLLKSLKR